MHQISKVNTYSKEKNPRRIMCNHHNSSSYYYFHAEIYPLSFDHVRFNRKFFSIFRTFLFHRVFVRYIFFKITQKIQFKLYFRTQESSLCELHVCSFVTTNYISLSYVLQVVRHEVRQVQPVF